MTETEEMISEQIETICRIWIERADPEKIILFGSAARGQMTRGSDLDFLVVWRGEGFPNNRRRAGYLKKLLIDNVTVPTDVLVLTPEQYQDAISEPRTFTSMIVREGEVVYERVA
jgi:predicted nucleotidyltransferase